MKRIVLLLTTALWFAAGSVYGQNTPDAYNQKGNEALQKKEYAEAFNWFKKSAEAGDAYGQYHLAFCYRNGEGVDASEEEAIRWFRASANGGCQYAYNPLGRMLEKSSPDEAFSWYKKSAEAGDKVGQHNLAMCYINGTGTGFNDAEARKWLKKSADQGHSTAKKLLADMDKPDFKKKPVIEFINIPKDVAEADMKIDVGIKATNGMIKSTAVYLNGKKVQVPDPRGFRPVKDDGYSIRIDRKLTLREGQNTIRVEATNRAGTGQGEVTVNYNVTPKAANYQRAEKRLALVIGNSMYHDADKRLLNPANDATDIAAKLKTLEFDVISIINATKRDMDQKINEFGTKARDYDVALFYYAGHGTQSNGVNYLIPTDAELASEGDMQYACVNAGRVLTKMEEARCKAKIVILDACRNNPFARSWYRGGGNNGLSVINTPEGTFIAYATSPGSTAADSGEGQRNSPYTEALLNMLDKPNLSLESFFKHVLRAVKEKTHNKQIPWSSSSFDGEFYFNKK